MVSESRSKGAWGLPPYSSGSLPVGRSGGLVLRTRKHDVLKGPVWRNGGLLWAAIPSWRRGKRGTLEQILQAHGSLGPHLNDNLIKTLWQKCLVKPLPDS